MDMNHEAHRRHEEVASLSDWTDEQIEAMRARNFDKAMGMSLSSLNDHNDDLDAVLRGMTPAARIEFKRAWASLVAEGLTEEELDY